MRIVVTGATGNVGTSVVDALGRDPDVEEIVGVARRLPDGWNPPRTRWVSADVERDDLGADLRRRRRCHPPCLADPAQP